MEGLKSSARVPICICGDAHAPPVGGKSLAQRRWKSIDFQEQRADPNLAQNMEEKMARSKHADKGVAMLMYDISWLLHGILYRNYPELPVTAGVGLGFWVVPSSHMLKNRVSLPPLWQRVVWSSYQRYRLSVGQPVGLVSPNF